MAVKTMTQLDYELIVAQAKESLEAVLLAMWTNDNKLRAIAQQNLQALIAQVDVAGQARAKHKRRT